MGLSRLPHLRLLVRIALAATVVAVVAVLAAATVSVGIVRDAARTEARTALHSRADLARDLIDASGPRNVNKPVKALREQDDGVTVARVGPKGRVTGQRLAKRAAYPRIVVIRSGKELSYQTPLDGKPVFVEVRQLRSGGAIVLAQQEADMATQVGPFAKRTLVALVVGLGVAVISGLLFAWRLAAPLRRVASAARELASGRRDVRLTPEGPPEVAEVAESLNVLTDALTHSENRQRDFLLSVSHELRTPLTAVKGFAEALSDGVATGEAAQLAGRTIVAESDRLDRLVSDMLDLARLGAQDFSVDLTRVDLTDLMCRAAGVWSTRCAEAGVRFDAELPAGPLPLVTDAGRVRQIVDNLAENALRVTPEGRPIVLATRLEGDGAVVEVRDGGPGLTSDDLAVAFERSVLYERYRGVRRVGTGVGLALVYGLATRLGGVAEAGQSAEGGARFTVRLPLGTPLAG